MILILRQYFKMHLAPVFSNKYIIFYKQYIIELKKTKLNIYKINLMNEYKCVKVHLMTTYTSTFCTCIYHNIRLHQFSNYLLQKSRGESEKGPSVYR